MRRRSLSHNSLPNARPKRYRASSRSKKPRVKPKPRRNLLPKVRGRAAPSRCQAWLFSADPRSARRTSKRLSQSPRPMHRRRGTPSPRLTRQRRGTLSRRPTHRRPGTRRPCPYLPTMKNLPTNPPAETQPRRVLPKSRQPAASTLHRSPKATIPRRCQFWANSTVASQAVRQFVAKGHEQERGDRA
jgi:hypothetical protein